VYYTHERLERNVKFEPETVEQKQFGRLKCRWDSSGSGKGPAVGNLNTVINLHVPQNTRSFFIVQAIISFSRTQLHGISYLFLKQFHSILMVVQILLGSHTHVRACIHVHSMHTHARAHTHTEHLNKNLIFIHQMKKKSLYSEFSHL
jgi:hypothetical protein